MPFRRSLNAGFVCALALALAACGESSSKKGKTPTTVINNANSANSTNSANSVNSANSTNSTNSTNPATCGNGTLDPGESCDPAIASGDGACPTSCTAPACATVTLIGTATDCTASCQTSPNACDDGDGCCPVGCDANSDADCENSCGNGVIEEPEICDGDCPLSCTDGNVCTEDILNGDPNTCSSSCSNPLIVTCRSGDGCCPSACTADTDSDCEPTAVCGDGEVDPGETCDGNCPTSCVDTDACTSDRRAGSPDQCNVICEHRQITSCINSDGCCPTGCTFNNDSDCQCTPQTCSAMGVECGPTDNGCGTLVDCGGCPSGEACSQGVCVMQSDGDGEVGDSCATDADCAVDPNNPLGIGLCLQTDYPGGYCSSICLPPLILCGTGAVCVSDPANPQTGNCHASCTRQSDCRSGYTCEPLSGGGSACLP